ncbi:MAG: hydantoinase/oxoprolinase family protein [Betaproteobacteria bacterium]|nr:hydantoinase/oxoprolinase family protein [Betaproteobacteria bacterium]
MAAKQAKKRVCIDVGGTFTDCLVLDETGQLTKFKASTTPKDPSDGFIHSVEKAARHYKVDLKGFLGSVDILIHGTTLATNTLITGRGAKTGMLTTQDFRDVLELRRGIKPIDISLYNLFIPPNKPLVPRSRRIGIEERTLYTGEIVTPLNERQVVETVLALKKDGVESLAVCFLHSYKNPQNERRAAAIAREVAPDMYVTTSHDTLSMWREFERFNTTVVGAYVGPMVTNYLNTLKRRLNTSGFDGALLMMLANGLVQPVDQCINRAVYLLDSGPAAAPSAAVYLGKLLGHDNLISIDMGGTSFDICLIRDGQIPTTTERWDGDQRIAIKMVDIETLGAGGGSIASIDSLGLLKVGPQSAGADPGPACYGRGTAPTVTDADVMLGYIPHDYFLGGEIKLDPALAAKASLAVAKPMGMEPMRAAEAIFTTINAAMADRISETSTKRGHDVRDCVLVAGGGGGPTHAGFIADTLGMPKVVIPSVAALFSAFGMFAMDPGEDYARSFVARCATLNPEDMNRLYEDMENEARESFKTIGVPEKDLTLKRTADMRYVGQFHEVETDVPDGRLTRAEVDDAVAAFARKHEALFTFAMPWQAVEVLALRLKAVAAKAPFQLREIERGPKDPSAALKRRRKCRFDGVDVDTPVYDGDKILAGNLLEGPAVVEESTMTVVVPKGFQCEVDRFKNYVLTRQH